MRHAGTLLACLVCHLALAQPAWRELTTPEVEAAQIPPVDREFRGVWVASVQNIDWPSAKNLTIEKQKAEIIRNLDGLSRMRMNAVLLQARPSCDALYPSALEPWSEYLTGENGKPPADPAYDPLQIWIEEAHKRSIDVHLWFNPFRARHFKAESPDAPTHIASKHPELVKQYDGYEWLDPGAPGSIEHTMKVVADLVTRYDIDGIAIDDYFYPYPKEGVPFPDEDSYAAYAAKLRADAPPGTAVRPPPKNDWRQQNINRFVERFYTDVKKIKPWVLVGVAPFGIWRPENPPGIKGMDAVAKLHADAKFWLAAGWLDYLSPQLYWSVDSKEQNFTLLLLWWAGVNTMDRHLWPSLYTSRVGADKAEATMNWIPDEIVRQIRITRERSGNAGIETPGQIHFSLKVMLENRGGINQALMANYATPALIPDSPWLASPGFQTFHWRAILASDQARTAVAWMPFEFPLMPSRWLVQLRREGAWTTQILPGAQAGIWFDNNGVDAVALTPISRTGQAGVVRAWTNAAASAPK